MTRTLYPEPERLLSVPVARYGPPDDPNYPDDEPTAYSNYAATADSTSPPTEPVPWYRKPVALVAFGALGAVLIALVVFGLAKLITGGARQEPRPRSPRSPHPHRRRRRRHHGDTTTEPTTTEPTTDHDNDHRTHHHDDHNHHDDDDHRTERQHEYEHQHGYQTVTVPPPP